MSSVHKSLDYPSQQHYFIVKIILVGFRELVKFFAPESM